MKSSLSFVDVYEGSDEEKNGEAADERGSVVKYGETPLGEGE